MALSSTSTASFVSIKLSGNINYAQWQEQIMCLMEVHDMLGFIDGTFKSPKEVPNTGSTKKVDKGIEEANYREWKRSDTLAKGWIYGSLSEDVMGGVVGLQTAFDVWTKLKTTYSTQPKATPAAPTTTTSNSTSDEGSQQYPYPSHVYAASFVSIKLSGETNYGRWQEQMMCLVESHDMLGFINGTLKDPKHGDSKKKADQTIMEADYREWKRSDTLVKGWIFGSLSDDVMGTVVGLHTANDVWKKLKTAYNSPPKATLAAPTTTATSSSTSTSNKDPAEYIPLCRVILRGNWEKADEHFNKDKNALTAKLTKDGYSALHIAIGTGENMQFVENLLNKINPESLPTMVDTFGHNPLHHAATVGNTAAAKMLVERNPNLLFILNKKKNLPIHKAIFGPHKSTFLYLLGVSKIHNELFGPHKQDGYHSPFEGENGAMLFSNVIFAGLFDEAYELIKKYPDMAKTKNKDIHIPMVSVAKNLEAYYSGTRYNFYERFVYTHVPVEINRSGNTEKVQDIENQVTYEAKVVDKFRSSFVSAIRRIHVKFWKIALLHVSHIKHLQEDKLKHTKALMILKCICEEVGKLDRQTDISSHYINATTLAVKNDTPEPIEEIVGSFPQAIWSRSDGYTLLQLAIINRCDKVYNLLVHQSINKFLHITIKDKDDHNMLHLAAQLAPMHKLHVVSGAALQMQRELQWFQEVEKLVRPRDREAKNKKKETPIIMFRKEHKQLRKEGEEWMKKAADSYTITAALIITIVFAAAITVPGGNEGDTGKAIYTKKPSFILFVVSDAISLFTSTTSLLLFLSILTARYAEEDFLYRLPKRLIFGLAMLFLSVTSMMVAFSATLYLMFGQGKAWIVIPIAALTCLPIASFVTLQFPLLAELISSTYGRGIFTKQSYHRINQHHEKVGNELSAYCFVCDITVSIAC